MNLFTSVKRKIINILQDNDLGIHSLSKKLDLSVSEIWRQMKQLQELKIVEFIKKGNKYKIFKLNLSNPIAIKILEINNLIELWDEAVRLEKDEGIFYAIDGILKNYYISSINVLISSSWDIPLRMDVIRVISIDEEREKVELLQNLSKIEIRCTYLNKKDFNKAKYYHEDYNKATMEQAIIDAFSSDSIDEADLAIQALYLADTDYNTLSDLASSQYDGKALPFIRYVFLLARTFGLLLPVSVFRGKNLENNEEFKNRTLQNFYRIFLGNQIARKMNLY